MSIVIRSLGKQQGESTVACVAHGAYEFTALVHGSKSGLASLVNRDCLAEMSFSRIASWKAIPDFSDEQSCIRTSSEGEGAIVVLGRVHNFTEVDDHSGIVDLYLQTGPEFLAISSQELGGDIPVVGTALEVTVYGLCFYPTGK